MLLPLSWLEVKQFIRDVNGTWIFDYFGAKSYYQCAAGGAIPRDLICDKQHDCEGFQGHPGSSCFWYKNNTFVEKPTLFDPELRTYAHAPNQDLVLRHPWRAPGSAPIDSPCGVAGGNINGCEGGKCAFHKGGFGYGRRLEEIELPYEYHVTDWKRGSIVEVVWGITANHGGGYSYRLCKVPEGGYSKLTEECFQQISLEFVGDKQWVQYGEDKSRRVEIQATRTTKGTYPLGSQWTKNPIPACIGGLGGFYYPTKECPSGTQFKPPRPDLFGFGVNRAHTFPPFSFSIVDKVRVPADLPAGDYVLSFRWDCEQTPQVWNTCASVKLW